MTAQQGRRPVKMSRLSLALAVGSSGTVAAAAVAGHEFTPPQVVAAFAMAGVVAAAGVRREPCMAPHVFQPVDDDADIVVIDAPRARAIAAHPAGRRSRSDAA